MGCCGGKKNLTGKAAKAQPAAPARTAPVAKAPTAFVLKDAFAMPIVGGWPLRVGDSKVVKTASLKEAQSKLRLAGKASSSEAAQDNICRELIAMGRAEACRPTGGSHDNRFFEEDGILDQDPRGPQGLEEGTYGAGARAWARLHRRALDGRLHPDYLRYFLAVMGCWNCQRHAMEIVKANPPDYRTNESQFEWTWRFHSIVSAGLGKPQITLEEAKAIWL